MSELEMTYDISHLIQTSDFVETRRPGEERHGGLERHVLPRPQFQAIEEQGLEVKI